jgi:hypothetical protein
MLKKHSPAADEAGRRSGPQKEQSHRAEPSKFTPETRKERKELPRTNESSENYKHKDKLKDYLKTGQKR